MKRLYVLPIEINEKSNGQYAKKTVAFFSSIQYNNTIWQITYFELLGVSYITANLFCICESTCFMLAPADAVQICGNIRSTQNIWYDINIKWWPDKINVPRTFLVLSTSYFFFIDRALVQTPGILKYTVCPRSSDPFLYSNLLYKIGHCFLDILQ